MPRGPGVPRGPGTPGAAHRRTTGATTTSRDWSSWRAGSPAVLRGAVGRTAETSRGRLRGRHAPGTSRARQDPAPDPGAARRRRRERRHPGAGHRQGRATRVRSGCSRTYARPAAAAPARARPPRVGRRSAPRRRHLPVADSDPGSGGAAGGRPGRWQTAGPAPDDRRAPARTRLRRRAGGVAGITLRTRSDVIPNSCGGHRSHPGGIFGPPIRAGVTPRRAARSPHGPTPPSAHRRTGHWAGSLPRVKTEVCDSPGADRR